MTYRLLLVLQFLAVLAVNSSALIVAAAFMSPSFSLSSKRRGSSTGIAIFSSRNSPTSSTTNDDFASFAASVDDDDADDDNADRLFQTKNKKNGSSSSSASNSKSTTTRSWKEDLEDLLDPATSMAKRQTLLADLLSANQDIRQAVQTALREQKARLRYAFQNKVPATLDSVCRTPLADYAVKISLSLSLSLTYFDSPCCLL
jgi:hypothetical protein